MQYHSCTRIWVRIIFLLHTFKATFFSPRKMDFFQRYHCWRLTFPSNLSVYLSPTSVTCRSDFCHHRKFNPKPCILTIWRVAGCQWFMRTPPQMRMQYGPPLIIDNSSPGGVSQEGVFHKCSDIYTPNPKTSPDQGMLNRYLPSRETPQSLGTRMLYHVWFCSCHPCNITLLFHLYH